MSTFDPGLLPEGCGACQQRVVKVDGRCPICATRAEQARAAMRPAVAVGPWPRVLVVEGAGASSEVREVRVSGVVDLGAPPSARVEPDLATPGAVVVTALLEGVRADGAPLATGRRTSLPGAARLELPLTAEVP